MPPNPPPSYPGSSGPSYPTYPPAPSYPGSSPGSPNPNANSTAGFTRILPFRASALAVSLTAVPGGSSYVLTQRPARGVGAAVLDIEAQTSVSFLPSENRFCNGPLVLPDGTPVFVGGDVPAGPNNGDGRYTIAAFTPDGPNGPSITAIGTMQYPRWYPTPCPTGDGKVLLVGGTEFCDAGATPPVAELWDPARPQQPTETVPMPPTFRRAAYWNWFPFIQLLPKGDFLWWGDTAGSLTDRSWRVLRDLPPLPPSFPYHTMYPHTATIALLALRPDNDYAPSFVIFGGTPRGASPTTPASPFALRLDLVPCDDGPGGYCTDGWVIEDKLGYRHVMGDSTVLPNGKVLLYGGAQSGAARLVGPDGISPASDPLLTSLMYDPSAPYGGRWRALDPDAIPRAYHAATCLHHTGEVLVAGCESCGGFVSAPPGIDLSPDAPFEYRLQLVTPAEVAPGVPRPEIVDAPAVIRRGSNFTVSYAYGPGGGSGGPPLALTGASLAAPCAATHSIDMNQRVILMRVASQSGGVAVLSAPPGPPSFPGLAPPGRYLLFLLGQQDSYSRGVWVQLGD